MVLVIKGRYHLGIPLLIGCGQLHLLSNQTAGLFDYQYLWKESTDIFDFLHGDNDQGKVGSKATVFWLGMASCASRPIRLEDFLIIISVSGKNQVVS